jgi:Tol biopolymer transport system component
VSNASRGSLFVGLVLVHLTASQVSSAPPYSAWSAATNLGSAINTAFDEGGPALSKDGLSLYFHSNRPGLGNTDLYVSHRESDSDPWGPPTNLGPQVNTAFAEQVPGLSRDGHFLFFASDRPGGSGDFDIWVSWREHTHDDLGWQPAVNVGSALNTAGFEGGPSFFENDERGMPQLFFASVRPAVPNLEIYVSDQSADGSFGPAARVAELGTSAADQAPDIRFDGLEMFIQSNRSGTTGLNDIWVSTRETVFDPWSTPANLGPLVNSAANDNAPTISADRRTLYFVSNRAGGAGLLDLWMSTRTNGRD